MRKISYTHCLYDTLYGVSIIRDKNFFSENLDRTSMKTLLEFFDSYENTSDFFDSFCRDFDPIIFVYQDISDSIECLEIDHIAIIDPIKKYGVLCSFAYFSETERKVGFLIYLEELREKSMKVIEDIVVEDGWVRHVIFVLWEHSHAHD